MSASRTMTPDNSTVSSAAREGERHWEAFACVQSISRAQAECSIQKKKKKKHATAASCPTQTNASLALQPIELSKPSGSGQSTVGSMSNSFSLSKVEDDKRAILTSLQGDSRAADFAASEQVYFLTLRRISRRTQIGRWHQTKEIHFLS